MSYEEEDTCHMRRRRIHVIGGAQLRNIEKEREKERERESARARERERVRYRCV